MSETIAMYVARLLAEAGVKRIWGITGDSLNGLNDSLTKLERIKWIGTRHEETAAFAAGADAAITGKLAVCAGSCGPGNLHLINGLFDCQRSHVPVIGHCQPYSFQRNRQQLLSGNPPSGTVQRMQRLLRDDLQSGTDALCSTYSHAPGDPEKRGGGGRDFR